METKIQKEFIETGFGFPVKLFNVPMVKVRGEWTPKVNYNELAHLMLLALSRKESRLTGAEVKFIRTHFEMTLQDFANRFSVTHVAVLKWEKSKHAATAMGWSTEKDVRLFVLTKLDTQATEFAVLYANLEEMPTRKSAPIHIDVQDLAA